MAGVLAELKNLRSLDLSAFNNRFAHHHGIFITDVGIKELTPGVSTT